MKTQLMGGPLDGKSLTFLEVPDRMVFVRNTDNLYVPDNNDPKIALRARHVYTKKGETMQYKQFSKNKQNNSI